MVGALLAIAGAFSGLSSVEAAPPVPERAPAKARAPQPAPAPNGGAGAQAQPGSGPVEEGCFAETICNLKTKLRWQKRPWDDAFCLEVARGFLEVAEEYELNPALLLAISVNESDLDEQAVATSVRGETVFAKDGGLMGIRCVLDDKGRCTNGNVRGLTWTNVMTPRQNIELGARELAHYRDGAGIERVEKSVRGRDGKVTRVVRNTRCQHRTHAYWAHYNHGPVYKSEGYPRHYAHRVAVLYYALVRAMGMSMPKELTARVTIRDRGQRERTPDRPVEQRYKELVEIIGASAGHSCRNLVMLN